MRRATFNPAADDGGASRAEAESARNPLRCCAEPCEWIGTAGDLGRFFCIAHHNTEAKEWPAITRKTEELQWFAEFIADVQRMSRRPVKGEQPWQAFAAQFWANADRTMQPDAREARAPGLYVYRMLGELRAMATGKPRPAAHVPQRDCTHFVTPDARRPVAAERPVRECPEGLR